MNTEKDKLDQLKAVRDDLDALEKRFLDELVKDGKKEQIDSFGASIEEAKKRLKDLNLVKDVDKLLQDDEESS